MKKHLSNKEFWALLAEGFLPLFVTYAMFFISDEGIKLYGKLFKQLKGEAVVPPLGLSGWFLVISLPVSGAFAAFLLIKRYKERIKEPDCNGLREKLDFYTNNISTLVDGLLYSFAGELNLGNSDRVTVYASVKTSKNDSEFIPIARYAGNPHFRSKGRASYPGDEGIISKAWHEGHYFDNKVPDPSNTQAYNNYHQHNYGVKESVCNGIKMKSRLYYGWRVKDSSGRKDVAVIILESTSKKRFTEEELTSFFENKKRFLREFVTNIRPLLPTESGSLSGF